MISLIHFHQALAGIVDEFKISRRDMFDPEAARGKPNTLWTTTTDKDGMLSSLMFKEINGPSIIPLACSSMLGSVYS